jgi:hypothetical protein
VGDAHAPRSEEALADGKMPSAQFSFAREEVATFWLLDEVPRRGLPRLGRHNPLNQGRPAALHQATLKVPNDFTAERYAYQGQTPAGSPETPSGSTLSRDYTALKTKQAAPTSTTQDIKPAEDRESWVQYEDEQGPLQERAPGFSVPSEGPSRSLTPEST